MGSVFALIVLAILGVGGAILGVVVKHLQRSTRRLQEDGHPISWLSYLLICVQSVSVVLAIGHQEIPMLLGGDFLTALTAGMALGLLVASVWAADMAVLSSLRRVPVLARNLQTAAFYEHLLYLGFVLSIECVTFGIVVYTLDRDPHALLSGAPLIPLNSPLFLGQVLFRAILLVWTSVQLFLVAGKIPPQWPTLMSRAREVAGGHALSLIEGLNLEGVSIAAMFEAYAAMSRPPSRVPMGVLNGWLRKRDAHRASEEARQLNDVLGALSRLGKLETGASVSTAKDGTGEDGTPLSTPLSAWVSDLEQVQPELEPWEPRDSGPFYPTAEMPAAITPRGALPSWLAESRTLSVSDPLNGHRPAHVREPGADLPVGVRP